MLTKPPHGYEEVKKTFGDPANYRRDDGTLSPKWEFDHIVRVPLPEPMLYVGGVMVKAIAIHRLLEENLSALLDELHDSAKAWAEISPYGGSYEPRLKRGAAMPSLHTWGIAVDFNPNRYPLGSKLRMPHYVVSIFEKFGWYYGANFHRPDPMHFQFAVGI